MRQLNDASSPSCSILQDAGALLVRNGAAGLVKKHLHNTWKFSATEEMGQIALSDFEYLPREREEGAPGVVLHPCAYNPGPALSGDKKKYIRQNQSSMEPQKERRFQEEGKNSLEGWSTGNPVSTEAPQTLQLGMGLVLWKLALHPPACPRLLTCRVRPEGLVQGESSEEAQKIMEQKGSAEQLFGKQAAFPGLPVGKATGKDKTSQCPQE